MNRRTDLNGQPKPARSWRSTRRKISRMLFWAIVGLIVLGIAQFVFGLELPFGFSLPSIAGSFLLASVIVVVLITAALIAYLIYASGKWGKVRKKQESDNKKNDGPSTWSRINATFRSASFWKFLGTLLKIAIALFLLAWILGGGLGSCARMNMEAFAPYGEGNDRSILFGRPPTRVTVDRVAVVGGEHSSVPPPARPPAVCDSRRRPIRLRNHLWTREYVVPQGCRLYTAPTHDPTLFDMQCRNVSDGELSFACGEYTTAMFRQLDEDKDTERTIQIWFEPVGSN